MLAKLTFNAALIAAIWAAQSATARADCLNADPEQKMAEAKARGSLTLSPEQSAEFVGQAKKARVPITRAAAVFLSKDGDHLQAEWLEEIDAKVTIHCDWDAKPESPFGKVIQTWLASK